MQSPLLLTSSQQSRMWVSTSEQNKNLTQSYCKLFPTLETLELNEDENEYSLSKKLSTHQAYKKKTLLFTEIRPHPSTILQTLENQQAENFIFHTYGNFVVTIEKWLSIKELLQNKKVLFLAASERQRNLVASFLKNKDSVQESPLPFPSASWIFCAQKREEYRKSLNISPEDTVFVYSGRISLQKNIHLLLQFLNKSLKKYPQKKFHFLVMGFIDELQHPFMNIELPEGYNFSLLQHHFKQLQNLSNLKIHFLGHCHKDKRHGYLCASDLFISLSLHHTEAFGMAPLEALSNGLPALLTDWGGYSSFAKHSPHCNLIPTCLDQKAPLISYSHFEQYLTHFFTKSFSSDVRLKQGEIYEKAYSFERFQNFWKNFSVDSFPIFRGFDDQALEKSRNIFKGYDKLSTNDYHTIFNHYCSSDTTVKNK